MKAEFNVNPLIRNTTFTFTARIKGMRLLNLKIKIAKGLILLACKILGCKFVFNIEELKIFKTTVLEEGLTKNKHFYSSKNLEGLDLEKINKKETM